MSKVLLLATLARLGYQPQLANPHLLSPAYAIQTLWYPLTNSVASESGMIHPPPISVPDFILLCQGVRKEEFF